MMETEPKVIRAHFRQCDTYYNKQLAYAKSQFPVIDSSPAEAESKPQVKMANIPESGFFIMLDFSDFIGKYFFDQQLQTSNHFQWLLKTVCGIDTISAEQCFGPQFCQLRFSLSIEEAEMKEACARIQRVVYLLTDTPKKTISKKEFEATSRKVKPPKKSVLHLKAALSAKSSINRTSARAKQKEVRRTRGADQIRKPDRYNPR